MNLRSNQSYRPHSIAFRRTFFCRLQNSIHKIYACKIVCTNSVAAVDPLAPRTLSITLYIVIPHSTPIISCKRVEMISRSIEILRNRDRDITAISSIKTDRANEHERTICLNTFATTRHMCDLPVSIESLASHIYDSSDFSFYDRVIEWNLFWTQSLKRLNVWRRYLLRGYMTFFPSRENETNNGKLSYIDKYFKMYHKEISQLNFYLEKFDLFFIYYLFIILFSKSIHFLLT